MNKVLSLDYKTQSFSTEYFTKENNKDIFRSEKAERIKSPDLPMTFTQNEQKNTQKLLQVDANFDSIYKHLKMNNENSKKPNFRKLCSKVALKLGFNVNSIGTNLLIDAVLYLYENHIDVCQMDSIYSMLSEKYNMKIKKIRWNIENSMKSMRKYTDEKTVCLFFTEYDGRFLTARYVIASAVYELRKNFTPEEYTNENKKIEKILFI